MRAKRDQEIELKNKEIVAQERKMDTMAKEFGQMLKTTLDKMSEKIVITSDWQGESGGTYPYMLTAHIMGRVVVYVCMHMACQHVHIFTIMFISTLSHTQEQRSIIVMAAVALQTGAADRKYAHSRTSTCHCSNRVHIYRKTHAGTSSTSDAEMRCRRWRVRATGDRSPSFDWN